MLLIGIAGVLLVLYCIVLYACIRISTPYDRAVDDRQQELYLNAYYAREK